MQATRSSAIRDEAAIAAMLPGCIRGTAIHDGTPRMVRTLIYWLQRLANPALFAVTIRDGSAQCSKGRAPLAFVDDCAGLAAEFGVANGRIEGVRGLHGIELRFSPSVPEASHQRFRNVFSVHQLGRG